MAMRKHKSGQLQNGQPKNGFSLIELAIVLAVIGLLAGGVLVAQTIIRGAEIQSVVRDLQRYESATAKFVATYASIPGDMVDATSNWAVAADGDGDGYIDNAVAGAGTVSEPFQYWRQLQLAELLDIAVTGANGAGATIDLQAGQNVPAGKVNESIWMVGFDASAVLGIGRMFDVTPPSNFFLFTRATSDAAIGAPVITPAEALNIDTKLDDGIPGTGRVIGFGWDNSCSSPNAGAAAADNYNTFYRASDETPLCSMVFLNAF